MEGTCCGGEREGAFLRDDPKGTRCSRTPRTPRPVLRTVGRDSISRSPPPPPTSSEPHSATESPTAARPYLRPQVHARAEPGPASGGGGRTARYSHPRRLSPPPAASAAAAGALCCSARAAAAAAERARAPVAPVTATPPGAARCAAVRIPSRPPPVARPRRRSPAEEPRRLVATSPRSPDTPARRPGLGLQQEGGRLDSLVEARGEGLWLGLTSGPFPGSSSRYPSPKVLVTPTLPALSLRSAAPFCPLNPSMT